MPETPDFDQIARLILEPLLWLGKEHGDITITPAFAEFHVERAAHHLRQVWNARGAADIATVETTVTNASDGWLVERLDRALRTLDRTPD